MRCAAGEISLQEAIRLGQQATRRYAKRQTTWFRHQLTPDYVVSEQYSERLRPEIFSHISKFLLT
jgi:tRNA dimethylallyltransferase